MPTPLSRQVRHLEAIMRISEAFCRMRLSEYCSAHDIDRAIAVTVESFVGSQKISAKRVLARAFAKYTLARPGAGAAAAGHRRRGGQRGAPTAVMA
jgi:DNA replication licensing factor MCM2